MAQQLEINLQPDEWLDITTKEELLTNEVNELREALDKRTKELELANQKVTELEGHKSGLESERAILQNEVELSTGELVTVEKKLDVCTTSKESIEAAYSSFKTKSVAQLQSMDQSLSSSRKDVMQSRDRVLSLEANIKDLKRQHEKEMKDCRSEMKRQHEKEMKETRMLHKEEINKRDTEVKELRALLLTTRKELAASNKDAATKDSELQVANKQLGFVALLAEDRKDARVSLERSVAQKKHALTHAGESLEQCHEEIVSLRSELGRVKELSENQIKELEESLGRKQDELDEAIDELMSKDLCLAEKSEELHAACQQIEELGTVIEGVTSQTSLLKEEMEESQAREKELEEKLVEQKDSYEHRLNEIREALGLKKPGEPPKVMGFPFKLPSHLKLV